MGSRVTNLILPLSPTPFFHNGQGYEGNEGDGCHEGNEGDEEEANLCQARKASRLCWQDQQDQVWVHCCRLQEDQDRQDCEQEGQRPHQGCSRPLDRSMPEGPQGVEHQGLRSYQEGHSTLQEGQGALQPVSSKSMRYLLQMWGILRLWSAGASVL